MPLYVSQDSALHGELMTGWDAGKLVIQYRVIVGDHVTTFRADGTTNTISFAEMGDCQWHTVPQYSEPNEALKAARRWQIEKEKMRR